MLSALIPSRHSYPALHLVAKPVDQRSVQPSPLVLGPTPLKRQRLQQIETDLSHAYCNLLLLRVSDYTTLQFLLENRRVVSTGSMYFYTTSLGIITNNFRSKFLGLHRYESIYSIRITAESRRVCDVFPRVLWLTV